MENSEDQIKKLGSLIKDVKIAMLTTLDDDGTMRSRPMATQKAEFDGSLWFFTRSASPKVSEAGSHPEVNVSYADPGANTYVSISGKAEMVWDKARNEAFWNPIYKAWFPEGLQDPQLALLRVHVEKAEYWDSPSSTMVQVAGFVKAIVTGHGYQSSPGEHAKINL